MVYNNVPFRFSAIIRVRFTVWISYNFLLLFLIWEWCHIISIGLLCKHAPTHILFNFTFWNTWSFLSTKSEVKKQRGEAAKSDGQKQNDLEKRYMSNYKKVFKLQSFYWFVKNSISQDTRSKQILSRHLWAAAAALLT